ncbi:hypothetical protein PF005_g6933 [Phytophthora fragariae]|uniref:Uncharacterized protein n=1 Tax=Phytophthora fragariae TaxID=53985 RepID=A0A6A3SUE6_9STRA|nr:hypothetical protein PF003_g16586 [Phytophthora fragariae]KAE8942530.1 hypothetical protein PF009_g7729 [Phytophthora fragariae]KAE9123141.1 hypothetical protein PF007_g7176 [Phytophthora fragariae]KAE9149455.1 hypothetical protein PF006_g6059 [Phytophthora fragariae]KAE9221889.1 hypothetical protein PF005_g6933 [Phytophthora fragariae]
MSLCVLHSLLCPPSELSCRGHLSRNGVSGGVLQHSTSSSHNMQCLMQAQQSLAGSGTQ